MAADISELDRRVSQLQLMPVSNCGGSGHDGFSSSDTDSDCEDPVVVGFVHKAEYSWALARQLFPSKAGGTPAWLDPIHLPDGNEIFCGICGHPLQFVLQVYAPIEGKEEAFHRMLFVFMCSNMACLQQHWCHQKSFSEGSCDRLKSVRVFRCQLSRENEFYSNEPPHRNGHDLPSCRGVALCSWCGSWRGGKVCGSCRQARYCSRSHQMEHWKAGHRTCCQHIQTNSPSSVCYNDGEIKHVDHHSVQHTDTGIVTAASNKLWPEFEIEDGEEGCSDLEIPVHDNAALMNGEKEDELTKEFGGVELSKEQRQWAGFQACIASAPDQVLRYCRSPNANILWPRLDGRLELSDIRPCPLCNSPRIFEFQILPQLLYFFGVSNEADSLDWATIAIFSCESSCSSSKSYVEEFAWVQLTQ
eukprot:c26760_g1_i1 orf=210-1457(+)